MTRRWARATYQMQCGGCGATLVPAAAIQLIRFIDIVVEKVRGECCADGPPPVDLPALEVPPEIQPPRRVVELPRRVSLDWKARAGGHREPGEED